MNTYYMSDTQLDVIGDFVFSDYDAYGRWNHLPTYGNQSKRNFEITQVSIVMMKPKTQSPECLSLLVAQ